MNNITKQYLDYILKHKSIINSKKELEIKIKNLVYEKFREDIDVNIETSYYGDNIISIFYKGKVWSIHKGIKIENGIQEFIYNIFFNENEVEEKEDTALSKFKEYLSKIPKIDLHYKKTRIGQLVDEYTSLLEKIIRHSSKEFKKVKRVRMGYNLRRLLGEYIIPYNGINEKLNIPDYPEEILVVDYIRTNGCEIGFIFEDGTEINNINLIN